MQRSARGLATGLPEYLAIRTDGDGRYRLGQLNPGHYRFEVRPTARVQWSSTASQVLELGLLPGAHGGVPHRVRVQPTARGEFAVDALEAGNYRLSARSASRGYS